MVIQNRKVLNMILRWENTLDKMYIKNYILNGFILADYALWAYLD